MKEAPVVLKVQKFYCTSNTGFLPILTVMGWAGWLASLSLVSMKFTGKLL